MILAFTGPSELTRRRELAVARRLDEIADMADGDTWRSGCALGVDTAVAYHAGAAMIDLELYVPAAPYNEEITADLENYASQIIRCGKTREPYRHRNEVMVKGTLAVRRADKLIAFVKSPVYYRSGEWMTINIARRARIEIELNTV